MPNGLKIKMINEKEKYNGKENKKYIVNFNIIMLNTTYYEDLKDTTLDTIRIQISFTMWEVKDGYQDIYLYNGSNEVWSTTINRGVGKDTSPQAYSYTIDLNVYDYRTVDLLVLKFHAHGTFEDDWQFSNFVMTITFTDG